jgi:hypothetical protein
MSLLPKEKRIALILNFPQNKSILYCFAPISGYFRNSGSERKRRFNSDLRFGALFLNFSPLTARNNRDIESHYETYEKIFALFVAGFCVDV